MVEIMFYFKKVLIWEELACVCVCAGGRLWEVLKEKLLGNVQIRKKRKKYCDLWIFTLLKDAMSSYIHFF